ncbi:MAG: hypothetical protein ACFFC7_09480 [Candidatus Hermodarchaeota archaeon]
MNVLIRIIVAIFVFILVFSVSIFCSIILQLVPFSLWLTLLVAIVLSVVGFFFKELGWIFELLGAFG